ncbi:MAG: tetratricopeptide repeat protein [Planctomycetota bacterium]
MPVPPTARDQRHPWLVPAAVAIALLGVVIAWVALGGLRPSPPPTDAELEQAIVDLSEKLEAAVVNGRDATPLLAPAELLAQRRPDAASAHRLLGQVQVELADWSRAYASFAEALVLEPDDPQLHRLAGGVAEQTENWTAARTHYEAARRLRPEDPALWVRLANLAVKEQKYDEAKPLLIAAIARQATLHEAHALRAAVLDHEGEPDAALASLEEAYNLASLEGGDALRRYAIRLAQQLREHGELVKASKVLRLPKPEDAFHPDVMAPLGQILEELGLGFEAGQYYEQWVQRDPTNAHAAEQAVGYYLRAEEAQAAEAMLVVLRRMDSNHPRLSEFDSALRKLANEIPTNP